MDVFLYNGELVRGGDLDFIEFVYANKSNDQLLLIVTTPGGSPDAAYKIGRYIQSKYKSIKVFVPGFCKSAGTLLAICADELIFSPYGELGPLDVQMMRTDNLAGMDSGLNISEAFLTLEGRAKKTFHDLVIEIISNSGGVVSFQTASHSASEIVSSLYGPIFGSIDPEEVGSRARAMRIGEDYGLRLNEKYKNLRPNALQLLSQTYSSHGFVIDMQEASALFKLVRLANDHEKELVLHLGNLCRIPNTEPCIENLTKIYDGIVKGTNQNEKNVEGECDVKSDKVATPKQRSGKQFNGKNTSRTSTT